MDEGESGVAILRGRSRRRGAACVWSRRETASAHLAIEETEDGRPALLERLCTASKWRETGSRGDICGDGGRRSARARGGGEERGLLLSFAWIAVAGD